MTIKLFYFDEDNMRCIQYMQTQTNYLTVRLLSLIVSFVVFIFFEIKIHYYNMYKTINTKC